MSPLCLLKLQWLLTELLYSAMYSECLYLCHSFLTYLGLKVVLIASDIFFLRLHKSTVVIV
jgi:hypothetical protein